MELCWRCSVEFQEDVAHLINSPEDGCLLPVRGAPTKPRETGQQCGMANCWRFGIFWSFFELKGMESIQIQAGEASKTAKTPVFSLFPSRLTHSITCVEDVRDHLNELAELATRASGFMGTGFAAEAWTKTGHKLWQSSVGCIYIRLYPQLLRFL